MNPGEPEAAARHPTPEAPSFVERRQRVIVIAFIPAIFVYFVAIGLLFSGSELHEWVVQTTATGLVTVYAAGIILLAILETGVHRRYSQRSRGVCAACGYDLRATPDRCPECGVVAGGAPA